MNLRTLVQNMLIGSSTPESQCARILKKLEANGRISNYEIWRMGIRRAGGKSANGRRSAERLGRGWRIRSV